MLHALQAVTTRMALGHAHRCKNFIGSTRLEDDLTKLGDDEAESRRRDKVPAVMRASRDWSDFFKKWFQPALGVDMNDVWCDHGLARSCDWEDRAGGLYALGLDHARPFSGAAEGGGAEGGQNAATENSSNSRSGGRRRTRASIQ